MISKNRKETRGALHTVGSERGLVKCGKELGCSVTAGETSAGFWAVWVLVYVLKQPLRCADVGKGEAETVQFCCPQGGP